MKKTIFIDKLKIALGCSEFLENYEMSDREKQIAETLRGYLRETADNYDFPKEKYADGTVCENRFLDSDEFSLKYFEDLGFFCFYYERGSVVVQRIGKDIHSAFEKLMQNELFAAAFLYERNNREKLKEEWDFDVPYESRKAAFEYEINVYRQIFGKDNVGTIKKYQRYLRNRGVKWKFDFEKRKFVK